MIRSFTAATAVATVFVALSPAAGAGPAPVQLAQMNAPPKIQPAPPPNLARPPVITPRIDTSRLAGEQDDGQDDDDDGKDTAGNPEQIPQETATGVVPEAPAAARRTAPPIVRLTRAPLPQARPDRFGGIDPDDLIDARGAAEAREAAEAAATAGVGVERSDLSGLGIPGADDDVDPDDPRLGGLTPDEYKERFGLGGASPEEIAHGLATEFNDLGNRGTSSPAGDFAAGFRPDPSNIPKGDLASDKTHTEPDGTESTRLPDEDDYVSTSETGWHATGSGDGTIRNVTEKERADGSGIQIIETFSPSGTTTRTVLKFDVGRIAHESTTTRTDARGQVVNTERGHANGQPVGRTEDFTRLHTPETAPSAGGGCAPSDGSAACQEWRRLMREGNSPGRLLDGSTRVNPGDPDDGATGDGPRIRISEEDLLGNPDPHRMEGGSGGPSARQIDGGKLVNPPDPNE